MPHTDLWQPEGWEAESSTGTYSICWTHSSKSPRGDGFGTCVLAEATSEERGTVVKLVAELETPESAEKCIVAVGRLNKLRVPGEAEAAVLASDDYQHKGLGTELLRRVIAGAKGMGLHRIVAEVLRDNVAIQAVFRHLGFRMRLRRDPSTIQMILDL